MTAEVIEYRCDAAEARELTDSIKEGVEKTYRRLLQAHRWRAWSALGYASWRDYAQTEFGIGQSRAYQLLDQARVVEEIEQAVSTSVELTEAQVRDLKPHLPAVIDAVREATADVPDDEKPAAAAEAIRQARAHVTTTTRTTEATKVEQDVDLNTGEILDDEPATVTELTAPLRYASHPSDSPAAIAAKAMSEARNSPWQVFAVKLLGDLTRWGQWLRLDEVGGVAGIVADLDAQPIPMTGQDESALRTLEAAEEWIAEIKAALTDRSRRHLRSVR